MIIADIQEKKDSLKAFCDEVDDLKFDYLIQGVNGIYIIERKSIFDFSHSINDDRLFPQIKRISTIAQELNKQGIKAKAILLIEGNIEKLFRAKKGGMSKQRYIPTILSMMDFEVQCIFTANENDTQQWLTYLNKKVDKDKEYRNIIKSAKYTYHTPRDESLGMICSFKGCGSKVGVKALQEHVTVKNIINLDEEEMKKTFGNKKGSHIYEVINYETKW